MGAYRLGTEKSIPSLESSGAQKSDLAKNTHDIQTVMFFFSHRSSRRKYRQLEEDAFIRLESLDL